MALRDWWTARRDKVLDWIGPEDEASVVEDWQLDEVERRAQRLVLGRDPLLVDKALAEASVDDAVACGDWDVTAAKWRQRLGVRDGD